MATSVESDTGPEVKNDPSTNTSGGSDSALEKNMDEARKPRIMYRVEWRYGDGEIAHEKEGHDEANLFIGHPTPESLPPLTITTVFHSSTTKERSKKMKKKKKKKKPDDGKHEQGKDTTVNQSETSNEEEEGANLEDFADSRASIKRMTIHSKKLINVLRDIVTYYPGLPLLGDGIYFYEPYQMLCHYMKDLRHYRDNQPPWHDEKYRKDCNQHLDILLEFLDDRYGRALQEEEARWARPTPVCTFEYLWLLFKPGETCYEVDDDQVTLISHERSGYIVAVSETKLLNTKLTHGTSTSTGTKWVGVRITPGYYLSMARRKSAH